MSEQINNILYQATSLWKELTEYSYVFTYGYKKQLHTVNLIFSMEEFPHLAGFQYLKDLSLPKYTPGKTIEKILDNTITYEQISKGAKYEKSVKPRLEAIVHLRDIIEKDFNFFPYKPRMYPFSTAIKADYLIASHLDYIRFVFILRAKENGSKCNYLCCSTFTKDIRDYETNQRKLTVLKKERIHLPTQTIKILYNKLADQTKNHDF